VLIEGGLKMLLNIDFRDLCSTGICFSSAFDFSSKFNISDGAKQ